VQAYLGIISVTKFIALNKEGMFRHSFRTKFLQAVSSDFCESVVCM
jgi:hypothetical protein